MKKLAIILVILLSLLPTNIFADNSRVVDNCNLLTFEQQEQLEDYYQEVFEKYGIDVAFLSVDENIDNLMVYADDYYDANYQHDGIILVINMNSREYWISARDNLANILDGQYMDDIAYKVEDCLVEGNFYQAAIQLGEKTISSIKDYQKKNEPISKSKILTKYGLISGGVGIVASIIVCIVLANKNKTVKKKYTAHEYYNKGSMNVTASHDLFLYRNISRRVHPKPTKSSSGSSIHSSSSGHSHSGRGGHF